MLELDAEGVGEWVDKGGEGGAWAEVVTAY
jgi:hypothetical protein